MRAFVLRVEICAAVLVLACSRSHTVDARVLASASASAPAARIESGPFVCNGDWCTQRLLRMPDDGEWGCADQEGTVWCKGGEPAAGVVNVARSYGYRCGPRRGSSNGERVCVDPAPDFPDGGATAYRCHYEAADFGLRRACLLGSNPVRPLPSGAPDCWLDQDCGGGTCDRGFCVGARP